MDTSQLHANAKAMVAPSKGILAADESNNTAGKRLASINLESTEENRRQYRELFLGTEGIENYLSGVILYDETIRQSLANGTSFVEHLQSIGVIPGIKVDMGLQDLPNFEGEKYTAGLDGLRARLAEYYEMGARFAKWRALITISNPEPSETCINTNAHILAMYAALCQEANIVPMIEPEILLDGPHTIDQAETVTTRVLQACFDQLRAHKVDLQGVILKSSMVLPGKDCPQQVDSQTIAEATIRTLKATVPVEVPGVVFLSGGQTAEQATENLNAINQVAAEQNAPWQLTFSYARALQGPSLAEWDGDDNNIPGARVTFMGRLKANSAARMGQFDAAMERDANGLKCSINNGEGVMLSQD